MISCNIITTIIITIDGQKLSCLNFLIENTEKAVKSLRRKACS